MSILLSIVVPTKNRYIYLKHLIKLFSEIEFKEVELILQDNSDSNGEFVDYLDTLLDNRIKYFYTEKSLDAIQNANLGILNSSGEYVCFIGDDDGFSDSIIDCCKWMKHNAVDSLVLRNPVYNWPDVQSIVFNFSGIMRLDNYTKKIYPIDPSEELDKVLKAGGTSLKNMPRVYQGIVSRKSLDEIYKRVHSFFPGPCPDMTNAVALCFYVHKCYFFDYPVIISGQGKKSAAGLGAQHKHRGSIDAISFLPKGTSAQWEKEIPKVWTGETIWAESCIKSLRNLHYDDWVTKMNYNKLYAKFLLFHPKFYKYLSGKSISRKINVFKISYYFIAFLLLRTKSFFKNYFFLKSKNEHYIAELKTIQEVSNYLNLNFPDTSELLNKYTEK